jgi:hypothetical protein
MLTLVEVYMTAGERVNLVDFEGRTIERVFVSVENGYLFVCKPEEYASASREGRDPVCIGFRPEYLIGTSRMAS